MGLRSWDGLRGAQGVMGGCEQQQVRGSVGEERPLWRYLRDRLGEGTGGREQELEGPRARTSVKEQSKWLWDSQDERSEVRGMEGRGPWSRV